MPIRYEIFISSPPKSLCLPDVTLTRRMGNCRYHTEYYDFEKRSPEKGSEFKCEEEGLCNGFCIFHDKEYLEDKDKFGENKEKVFTRLMTKVNDSINNDKPLFCIGYYLPNITDITFERNFANFAHPVYFSQAKLKQVDFSKAKFCGVVSFIGAEFSGEADFREAEFSRGVFNSAKFIREVYFNDAKFGRAEFNSAKFYGEANFTSAKFSGDANFREAEFSGEAYFDLARFSRVVSFNKAQFGKATNFREAEFTGDANFREAEFTGKASFSGAFHGKTSFNYVLFEDGKKIFFETDNLSNVSFMNTDITRVRFSDRARWGDNDRFKVIEEEMLEWSLQCLFRWNTFRDSNSNRLKDFLKWKRLNWIEGLQFEKIDEKTISILADSSSPSGNVLYIRGNNEENMLLNEEAYKSIKDTKVSHSLSITLEDENTNAKLRTNDNPFEYIFIVKKKNGHLEVYPNEQVSLGTVMTVYRNLRENYEFRLRYDEAGKFFIKEMELKRKYREDKNAFDGSSNNPKIVSNGWLRRNFSLTGLYYNLSRYGHDLLRPTLVGVAIIFLSTLFWLTQSHPTLAPTLNFTNISPDIANHTSTFVILKQAGNHTHWLKAFERSIADFIPLLTTGSDVKVGAIDYVIKIAGGAVTFGLIIIALRRKFERKYTR